MTDEQKREHISFLYRQLDTCGQIIEEAEPGSERSRYNREYRRIINALRRLEPEKWKGYPMFRQYTTEGRNEMVQKFLAANRCPKCGGEFKQTRSGSFRIVCQQCGQKAQLRRRNKKLKGIRLKKQQKFERNDKDEKKVSVMRKLSGE